MVTLSPIIKWALAWTASLSTGIKRWMVKSAVQKKNTARTLQKTAEVKASTWDNPHGDPMTYKPIAKAAKIEKQQQRAIIKFLRKW